MSSDADGASQAATPVRADEGPSAAPAPADLASRIKGLVVHAFWRIEHFLAVVMGLEDSKYQSYVDESVIEGRRRREEERDTGDAADAAADAPGEIRMEEEV